MKSKEELIQIKKEMNELGSKLAALSDDELMEVAGGMKVAEAGYNMPGIQEDEKYVVGSVFEIPEKENGDHPYEYTFYKLLKNLASGK